MHYHHGDLRRVMLEAAADAIGRDGVDRLSIRGLARATEVSHTAFRHHFGDRRGLLTALAAQGYDGMTAALHTVEGTGSEGFLETGVAYIEWALSHPAHFQVMFRPDLVEATDSTLQVALEGLARALMLGAGDFSGRAEPGDPRSNPLALAAWSMTHGFATLALAGNLPGGVGSATQPPAYLSSPGTADGPSVAELARATLRHLALPG